MANKPHVVMVPFPVQGHVIPLLQLAHRLAQHGDITITFITTDLTHNLIVSSLSRHDSLDSGQIRLVSVADGLQPEERHVPGKFLEIVHRIMPARVKEVIQKINGSEQEDGVSCVVYDQSISGIGEVAKTLGVGSAAFLPAAAALLVLSLSIPKLIEDGIVDNEGSPLTNEAVQLAPSMPTISPSDFVWNRAKIPTLRRQIFATLLQNNNSIKSSDWIVCNSVRDLEPGAFTSALSPVPIVPIGPLLSTHSSGLSQLGHFQIPDSSSMDWLDKQPRNSVIYVAFGSTTVLGKSQLHELALGLEITNKPFLWVNSAANDAVSYPEGFLERVACRSRIVRWAPQQEILRHGSLACFVSHCGWNSSMESVCNGVPMVCWAQMADQFVNQVYVCDVWGMGVRLVGRGGDGEDFVIRDEIKERIEEAMGEGLELKKKALKVKEMAWRSVKEEANLYGEFVNWILQGLNCKKQV